MSTGKKVVFIVIIAAIVGIIIAWLWLQKVIVDYDLETTMTSLEYMKSVENNTINYSNLSIKL